MCLGSIFITPGDKQARIRRSSRRKQKSKISPFPFPRFLHLHCSLIMVLLPSWSRTANTHAPSQEDIFVQILYSPLKSIPPLILPFPKSLTIFHKEDPQFTTRYTRSSPDRGRSRRPRALNRARSPRPWSFRGACPRSANSGTPCTTADARASAPSSCSATP